MKFGSHFEVEFNSDAQSELTKSFIFEFEPDVPSKSTSDQNFILIL